MNLIEQFGGIELAKLRLKQAKENGCLLLSVEYEGGIASIYDFKLEEAIKNWELTYE